MPRYRRPLRNMNPSAVERIVNEFELVVASSGQSLELDGAVPLVRISVLEMLRGGLAGSKIECFTDATNLVIAGCCRTKEL